MFTALDFTKVKYMADQAQSTSNQTQSRRGPREVWTLHMEFARMILDSFEKKLNFTRRNPDEREHFVFRYYLPWVTTTTNREGEEYTLDEQKRFFAGYDCRTQTRVPLDGSNGFPIITLLEGPPRNPEKPDKPYGLKALKQRGFVPALEIIKQSLQDRIGNLNIFTKPVRNTKGCHILEIYYGKTHRDFYDQTPSAEPEPATQDTTADEDAVADATAQDGLEAWNSV